MVLRIVIGVMLGLVALPALAQTDDRVLNDVVKVLASNASLTEAWERAVPEGELRATPERCATFAAKVEDGGEDMSVVEELLTSQVTLYAKIVP